MVRRSLLMTKLNKQNVEDILALTPLQEGILFHYLKDPRSDEYCEQLCLGVSGAIDETLFKKVWQSIISRNEMLRTLFRWEKVKAPVQIVLKEHQLQLKIHYLQGLDEHERESTLEEIKQKDREMGFDLTQVPFRITLCKCEEEKYEMIISNHHILYDGWSNGIILKEFLDTYRAFARSETLNLSSKKKYKDFVKYIQSQDKGKQKEYWQKVLEGFDTQTRLVSKKKSDSFSESNRDYQIRFSKALLEGFARQNEVTLAALIYSVWGVVLQKYNDCEDIIFGTTVSGRSEAFKGIEDLVGLFINTIPLRIKRSPDETVTELIKRVNRALQDREEYENTPLTDIKRYSELDEKSDLFDTIVVFENYPLDRTMSDTSNGLAFHSFSAFELTNYDLSISVMVFDDVEVCFSYNEQLVDATTIQRLAQYFTLVVEKMIQNPEQQIRQIEIVSLEEKNRILYDFNNTSAPYSENMAMSQLFEQQVLKTPDQLALVYGDKRVTYQELDEMSNSLAHELISKGIEKGDIVGIMVEPSVEMIAGIIAILKAGGAYLPVDPEFPESRKRYMFQNSSVNLLLTEKRLLHKIDNIIEDLSTDNILLLDEGQLFLGKQFSPCIHLDSTDLFAVFYTSGTTGKPKGVMVEHRGVVNLVQWFGQTFEMAENTNMLQLTNFIFDPSILEFFGTLLYGATLHLVGKDILLNKQQFCDYIDQYQIHIINFIPSALKELLCHDRTLQSLRTIISGGEVMEESLKNELISKGYELYNHYGPTETTIDALSGKCSVERKVSIGKPVSNVRCYILDQDYNLAPIGVPGQIFIAGTGVTKGYLNMPEATNEKFMKDPFVPNERMYQTGDLGKWLPNGEIEFLGRKDYQVKIRGFRVELGEIQRQLLRYEQVNEAVVLDWDRSDGKKMLCAYIVGHTQVDIKKLKEFISIELPYYMVPTTIVQLDKLPVTSIGKIDRKALPAPDFKSDNEYVAPRNQTEETLADIWASVLGIDQEAISVIDNFFELGGDSILSIQIAGRAKQKGLDITVSQMFQYQTIRELASVVNSKELIQEEITQAPETGEVLLTPIQKWFFEQSLENIHQWNQSVLLETDPDMSPERLSQSFQILTDLHDSFRLRFHESDGKWIQAYMDHGEHFPFEVYDMTGYSLVQRDDRLEEILSNLQHCLNITDGPLIRAAYFDFGSQEKGRLFITAHHLIVDGYSWRVIVEDLQDIYEQLANQDTVQLPPKSISFKKWSESLYEYAYSEPLKDELGYWSSITSSSVHSIPVDLEEGRNTEGSARTISVSLPEEETNHLLYDIHHSFKTRIDDILLSALSLTFGDWNETTLIDLEGHGRGKLLKEHDVSRTIGWFTTVYPIILGDLAPNESMEHVIKRVKERVRNIPIGGIGYGILAYLSEAGIRETIASQPRAEVAFNYLGQVEQSFKKNGLFKIAEVNSGPARDLNGVRSHLIEIDCMIVDKKLKMEWKYSLHKHLAETIGKLADTFVENLKAIIRYCKANEIAHFTPSDFPLASIEQNQLDEWTEQYQSMEDIYTLSPVQQSMVFHHVYSPSSSVTVEQTVFTIKSALNIVAFEKVWQTILDRHESLRASYHWEGLSEPVQIVHKKIKVPFVFFDWTNVPESEGLQMLEQLIEEDRNKGFDLSKPPLMRVWVVKRQEFVYDVIWTHHHLQLDGWCNSILFNEIGLLYEAYCSEDQILLENPLPYKEYIKWFRKQDMEKAEAFWTHMLKGFKTPIRFHSLFPAKTSMEESIAFGDVVIDVPQELQETMQNFAKKHRITLNTIVQGAWAILLNRYSSEKDIVFGVTSSGRPTDLEGSDAIIGCFMNTLPFRVHIDESTDLLSWLQDLQWKQVEMRQYEYTPLADIRSWSETPRNSALFDLYESIFIFENYPFDSTLKDGLGSLKVESIRVEEQMDYPVVIYCNMQPELHFKLLYDRRYLNEVEADQLLGHLYHIICELLKRPAGKISEISMMSEQELTHLLIDCNETAMDYPKELCFNDLFEKQVNVQPDQPAIMQNNEQLTYSELDVLSNQLAHKLMKLGVGPEVPVGIFVDRSIKMVVGILSVLKAGGAFLPIDADYPSERVDMMLEDAQVPVLLTTTDLKAKIQSYRGRTVCLDMEWESVLCESGERPNSGVCPENLAYIIYTSGSSGRPKGVMMPHEAVVSHSIDIAHRYQLVPEDRVLQFSSISFDISLEQVLTTLAAGATLVLRDKEIWTPYQFSKKCQELGLTVANLPTTYWGEVAQEWHIRPEIIQDNNLRLVVVGGEQMPPEKVALWEQLPLDHILFLNAYGPAETAMTSTLYTVSGQGTKSTGLKFIPVGKPLANRRIYILDESMKPLPIGIKGEIFIGGIPLARGYLNNPDLTNEKFIQDPFYDGYGNRLYRTGDLGRMLHDGSIEVLGRKDEQTKIRGHRIDVGEIEVVLNQYPAIKDAVVVVKAGETNEKVLAAFYVVTDSITVGLSEIREYLRKQLPEYMIPSYFIQMDKLPLNPNGKIDRKALANMEIALNMVDEYERPHNETQQKLVSIWERILGVEGVGINNHFFELGGQSLKAITLLSEIHREFEIELPLVKVFDAPTIKELAAIIEDTYAMRSGYVSIEPIKEKEYYEVSAAQRRMFIVNELAGDSTNYNIPSAVILEGKVDVQQLEQAFNKLIERHESLRTSFEQIDGHLVQKIHPHVEFNIQYLTVEEHDIERVMEQFIQPFNLRRAPLFRVAICKLSPSKYVLMYDMHHIVSDGLSIAILIREFTNIVQGKTLPDLTIQYKDFSAWQNQLSLSGSIKKQEEFWLRTFSGDVPLLDLPTDYARPDQLEFTGDEVPFYLSEDITSKLYQVTRTKGVTLYSVLMAAFYIVLFKHSGQEDIVVGSPIAGRRHVELENVVGMFVNTLAFRNYPQNGKTLERFIEEVAKSSLEALEHQDYPFEMLVEKLQLKRELNRHPLFDVMFAFENVDMAKAQLDEFEITPFEYSKRTTKFDLELKVTELEGNLNFVLEYSTSLFRKATIERMAEHLVKVIEIIAKDITIPIGELDLLTTEEKETLLIEFNDTKTSYPKEKTIKTMFEKQVEKNPHRTAVVFDQKKLSYQELNKKANQLANVLISKGAKPNTVIGLLTVPSIEMIVGLLGIIKTGATYLPIDTEFPSERIKFMLEASGSHILVSHAPLLSSIDYSGTLIDLDSNELFSGPSTNPEDTGTPEDPVYIIYTSGTTGNPKGVPIKNQSLVNYISWFTREGVIESKDKTILLSSFAFDLGYTSLYSALLNGCELHLVPKELAVVPENLLSYLVDNQISYMKLTPSLFHLLVQSPLFERNQKRLLLRLVVLGGEEMRPADIGKFNRLYPGTEVMNHYGPTETTIGAIAHKIDFAQFDPLTKRTVIGRPIDNVNIFILDSHLKSVPIGVAGEICIAGAGLSEGYLNQNELSKEMFIEGSWFSQETIRLYRTGDLGRFAHDGKIEFLGRIDNQVKIRGFRVEPEEVATVLLQHDKVVDAIVIVKKDDEFNPNLYAYVVLNEEMDGLELRQFLQSKVPYYMMPSAFIKVEKIQLTPNGKVDYRALPEFSNEMLMNVTYEMPIDPIDRMIADIWKEVLEIEKVGVNDSFFELGGNSLKAMLLTAKIQKQLHTRIPLREVFQAPTVRGMREYIKRASENPYSTLQPIMSSEFYELSSAQRRLYTLSQMEGIGTSYNMPRVTLLEGEINKERLERAFEEIVKRHEAFRSTFVIVDGEPKQRIQECVEVKISYIDIDEDFDSHPSEELDEHLKKQVDEWIQPFDLSQAPLLRIGLIRFRNHKHLLLTDMHHIISDGYSVNILVNEFTTLYQGNLLPENHLQYKDFAGWQNEFLKSEEANRQEEVWLDLLSGELPVLNLPTDFPRPAMQSFEGDCETFKAGQELKYQLDKICLETDTTLYMVLTAAYSALLFKYSRQQDIIIGSPILGRTHPDLQSIIGLFANTFAVRSFPNGNKSFIELLSEIKTYLLKAYENQDVQFDLLIDKLNIKRDPGRNPIFSTMLTLSDAQKSDGVIQTMQLTPVNYKNSISKFDLSIFAEKGENDIHFELEYASKLFGKETMQKLVRDFLTVLKTISCDVKIKLDEIEMEGLTVENTEMENVKFNFFD